MFKTASSHCPTLEHWMNREPFVSNHRSFAAVELAVVTPYGNQPYLMVRGWIVDVENPISKLNLSINQSERGMTVHSLVRSDVGKAFPTIHHSLRSGFSSLLPYSLADPSMSLNCSYQCTPGDNISFTLLLGKVSLGVVAPGVAPIQAQNLPVLDQFSSVVIADFSDQGAERAFDYLVLEASKLGQKLTIFSDNTELRRRRADPKLPHLPIRSAASSLLQSCLNIRNLIFIGPRHESWIRGILIPVLSASPATQITWIAVRFSKLLEAPLQGPTVRIVSADDPLLHRRVRDVTLDMSKVRHQEDLSRRS